MPVTTDVDYDAKDPIHVLQRSIERNWSVDGITKVYYTGKFVDFASPSTGIEDSGRYCILDFGDAEKACRTNCSVIWSIPVTIVAYGISVGELRPRVTALGEYLCPGEHRLDEVRFVVIGGDLISTQCSRVLYQQIDKLKAKAEFEMVFRLNLPMR